MPRRTYAGKKLISYTVYIMANVRAIHGPKTYTEKCVVKSACFWPEKSSFSIFFLDELFVPYLIGKYRYIEMGKYGSCKIYKILLSIRRDSQAAGVGGWE